MNNTSICNNRHLCLQHFTPTNFQTAEVVILAFLLSACLFGNTLVIVAIMGMRKLRKASNFLIINLSVCDMATAISGIPFTLILYNIFHKARSYPFGKVGCKIIWPAATYASNCSSFTLTCIAIERYFSITQMMDFSKRGILSAIVSMHTLALLVVLPYIINLHYVIWKQRAYCYEHWAEEWHMKAYTISLFVFQYILPLLVMAVFYFLTWREIYKRNTSVIKMCEEYENIMNPQEYEDPKDEVSVSKKTSLKGDSSTVLKKECGEERSPERKGIETEMKMMGQMQNRRRQRSDASQRSDGSMKSNGSRRSTRRRTQKDTSLYNRTHCRKMKRFQTSKYQSQVSYTRRQQTIRMLKMCTALVIVFAFCALPNQIMWLMNDYTDLPATSYILTYLGSILNCWIYGYFHNTIRQAYSRVLCCSKKTPPRRQDSHSRTTTISSLYDSKQEELRLRRKSTFDHIFEKETTFVETTTQTHETLDIGAGDDLEH